jgi:hypothetical protein
LPAAAFAALASPVSGMPVLAASLIRLASPSALGADDAQVSAAFVRKKNLGSRRARNIVRLG